SAYTKLPQEKSLTAARAAHWLRLPQCSRGHHLLHSRCKRPSLLISVPAAHFQVPALLQTLLSSSIHMYRQLHVQLQESMKDRRPNREYPELKTLKISQGKSCRTSFLTASLQQTENNNNPNHNSRVNIQYFKYNQHA